MKGFQVGRKEIQAGRKEIQIYFPHKILVFQWVIADSGRVGLEVPGGKAFFEFLHQG
jgi:hypothetical protein